MAKITTLNESFAFLVAFIISFLGSMPPAIINIQVIFNTLNDNAKDAKLMALGAMLPEIPYAILAIYGVRFIQKHESVFETINWLIIPLFLAFGFAMFFQKPKDNKGSAKSASFMKGLLYASLNPMLPVFWVGILLAFNIDLDSYSLISPKITFPIGCSLGAFALLSMYIFLAKKFKDKILNWIKYPIHKVVAFIFFGIAIVKVLQITVLK